MRDSEFRKDWLGVFLTGREEGTEAQLRTGQTKSQRQFRLYKTSTLKFNIAVALSKLHMLSDAVPVLVVSSACTETSFTVVIAIIIILKVGTSLSVNTPPRFILNCRLYSKQKTAVLPPTYIRLPCVVLVQTTCNVIQIYTECSR
jgi:hypothetical protein